MIVDWAMMWLAQVAGSPSGGPSRLHTLNSPGERAPTGAPGSIGAGTRLEALPDTDRAALSASQIVEAARLSPAMALMLIAVSLLITAGVLWWAFWWWRVKNEPAGRAALASLVRRLGLTPAEADAIEARARARGVPAVGLLVSPSAMREALGVARAG